MKEWGDPLFCFAMGVARRTSSAMCGGHRRQSFCVQGHLFQNKISGKGNLYNE